MAVPKVHALSPIEEGDITRASMCGFDIQIQASSLQILLTWLKP